MRKLIAFISAVLLVFSLVSCGSATEVSSHTFEIRETEPADTEEKSEVDFDLDTGIPGDAVNITLNEDTAEIDGEGAELSETTLEIVSGGCYVLSGIFYGTLHVNAPKTDAVHLVFDGAEIYSDSYAAIYAENADKVKITLKDGTENAASDGSSYVTEAGFEPNACIFANCDLTVNGGGKLSVMANCNNAISSEDTVTFVSGSFDITASKNAVKGKDGVNVFGGIIDIRGSKDGIKSDGTKPGHGIVNVTGGEINVTCSDDAIQAETGVTVKDCKITANAGDKVIACDVNTDIDYSCIENLKEQ